MAQKWHRTREKERERCIDGDRAREPGRQGETEGARKNVRDRAREREREKDERRTRVVVGREG